MSGLTDMEPSRQESGWMSLLDVSRTEERISHLRFVQWVLIGGVTVWAFSQGDLAGTAAVVAAVSIAVGLAAALVTLSVARTRNVDPITTFVNNGIDVTVVSGVLIASFQGPHPNTTLALAACLGYLLVVAVSGLRYQLRSSLFAAGFAAAHALGAAIYLYLAPNPALPTQVADLVLVSVLLVASGGLAAAMVLGARSSAATFDEAERNHRRVLNQVSDGLLVCNAVGRIVDVNAAASEVLGLPRSVLVDLEASTALPGPLAKELENRWNEILHEGFIHIPNLQIDRGRGDLCDLDVTAHRIRYRGDDVVQIVLNDTTAERRLRDQTSHYARLRSVQSLASGIAHEFNNMFASIEASSYVLAEAIPKTAAESTEVEIIRSAAARAAGLVRELHDLTDVRKPNSVPLDVTVVLERALVAGRGSGSAPVRVDVDVAPDIKRLLGDEGQVVRALGNLIGCAYAAMLDGGSLKIRAENLRLEAARDELDAGDYVAIRVEDTGIGIPADMVERAFDPFSATDGRRWTGFALANVRAVVSRHGGSVDLVSNLGRGTVYTVRLPATEQPIQRGATPLPSRVSTGRKIRLLVVDDEPANRNSLARLLSTRGYEVVLAEDGRHAIETCEKHKGQFDLVLLDLVMPGLNGKDVVVALRARYPDLKVLLVTGFADQQLLEEALELGAASSATKPFDVPELLGQIQELTNREPDEPVHPVNVN